MKIHKEETSRIAEYSESTRIRLGNCDPEFDFSLSLSLALSLSLSHTHTHTHTHSLTHSLTHSRVPFLPYSYFGEPTILKRKREEEFPKDKNKKGKAGAKDHGKKKDTGKNVKKEVKKEKK